MCTGHRVNGKCNGARIKKERVRGLRCFLVDRSIALMRALARSVPFSFFTHSNVNSMLLAGRQLAATVDRQLLTSWLGTMTIDRQDY